MSLEKESVMGKSDPNKAFTGSKGDGANNLKKSLEMQSLTPEFIAFFKKAFDIQITNGIIQGNLPDSIDSSNLNERNQLAKGTFGIGDPKIRLAQASLVMAGYNIGNSGVNGVDGKLGDLTKKAIKDLQQAVGLKPNGNLDTTTMFALDFITKKGFTRSKIEVFGRSSRSIGLVKVDMPLPADKSRFKEFTPYLDASIVDKFNAFVIDCKKEGIPLVISEGFRTRAYQEYLFTTDPDAAKPGTSPHESGLAFDLDWEILNEKQQSRLLQIAEKYDFYQTVMPSEPWHFGIKANGETYQRKRDYNSKDWLRIEQESKSK